jgi:hypothetical protein
VRCLSWRYFLALLVDYLGKLKFILFLLGLGKESILLFFHFLVTSVIFCSIRVYNPTISIVFVLK